MMEQPKISIIVPVFNQHDYIRRCLDSVLLQSMRDIEIICVNDGSTDDSSQIIKRYAQIDPRIRCIDKENSGYGHSVNIGIEQSRGEYIAIVEPDDTIEYDMMETLYVIAERDDLDWVKGDITSVSAKEERRESITCGQDIYNMVLDPQTDVRPHRTEVRTWAGIYRASFVREHNIKHNETPGASYQDFGFMLKTLYYARRVEFVDRPFYRWTVDNPNSSINVDSKTMLDNHIREFDLDKEYLSQHPELSPIAKGSLYYRMYCSSNWLMDQLDEEDKSSFIRYFKDEMCFAYDNGLMYDGLFTRRQRVRLETRVFGTSGMMRMESRRLFRPKDGRRRCFS